VAAFNAPQADAAAGLDMHDQVIASQSTPQLSNARAEVASVWKRIIGSN